MPDRIDAFRHDFMEHVAGIIDGQDMVTELRIDVEAPLCQLTVETIDQIDQLAPFGAGNSRPILSASGLSLAGPPKLMGKDQRHLSLDVIQDGVRMRCVAFGKAEWSESLPDDPAHRYDFAFKPVINDFRGQRRVELHLIDFRPASVAESAAV
jgi:single-stranded-DNA-specific exonuclease